MIVYSCVGKAKFSAAITLIIIFFDEYKGKQKKLLLFKIQIIFNITHVFYCWIKVFLFSSLFLHKAERKQKIPLCQQEMHRSGVSYPNESVFFITNWLNEWFTDSLTKSVIWFVLKWISVFEQIG